MLTIVPASDVRDDEPRLWYSHCVDAECALRFGEAKPDHMHTAARRAYKIATGHWPTTAIVDRGPALSIVQEVPRD